MTLMVAYVYEAGRMIAGENGPHFILHVVPECVVSVFAESVQIVARQLCTDLRRGILFLPISSHS